MANFSTSTNIIRDVENNIQYIPTPNAHRVFQRVIKGFKTGQHSFNIIGSYGTGKSSFLWAFEKNLREGQPIFEPLNGQFSGLKKFKFFKVVGESHSLITVINRALKVPIDSDPKSTLQKLDFIYKSCEKRNEVFIIVIDEFGKFLEYASKNDPDRELYFIQQLAEYVNDPNKNILFLLTLHQNFKAYAKGLDKDQKQEWDKVKGRLIEVAFDEPIEQLLFLSAEKIKNYGFKIPDKKSFNTLFDFINKSKLISNSENLDKDLAKKLYPLDYLSANILTQSLQKYGQNERSLFTFLASSNPEAIQQFSATENKTYNVAHIFDYLVKYLSSDLEDIDSNPHKPIWRSIFKALEKAEALNEDDFDQVSKIIKTIGLINIFGKEIGHLDEKVLSGYAQFALDIPNSVDIIQRLTRQKIIKYFSPRNKYFFLEGTDVDFEKEYLVAAQHVSPIEDVTGALKYYIDFPLIAARRIQYKKGTPRFFQFQLYNWEDLEDIEIIDPKDEVDGFINIILTERRIQKKLEKYSKNKKDQVYVLFKYIDPLKDLLFDLAKNEHLRLKFAEDNVAQGILLEEKHFLESSLKNLLFKDLFKYDRVFWIYNGLNEKIKSYKDLNRLISEVSDIAYPDVPIFRNEMVNKEQLSTPILTARKALLDDLLQRWDQEDLGYPKDKFPPQKSIYLSLLKDTGIHKLEGDHFVLSEPVDKSFKELWSACKLFLQNSTSHPVQLNDLYKQLKQAPFKLKQGFIDFWVPIFLIIHNEDYALFYKDDNYVPYITSNVLDLIHKKPEDYQIKAYYIEGVKADLYSRYKDLASLDDDSKGKGSSFISIFSQFIRFYNDLPNYSKRTTNISKSAINLREAINKAKDPYDALFSSFPQALGFHDLNVNEKEQLELYLNELNQAIFDLRTAFDNLLNRIETKILEVLNITNKKFIVYQTLIQKRFSTINEARILDVQRAFYKRLMSPLEDRDSYLQSICDALLSKTSLKNVKDEEEVLLMLRLAEALSDMEKLLDIHQLQKERESDQVWNMEILDATGKKLKDQIVVSSEKEPEVTELEHQLLSILVADRAVNKAALLKIISKFFDHDKN